MSYEQDERAAIMEFDGGLSRKDADSAADAIFNPTDPNVIESDRPRLRGQNKAILERLERGPATNVELASISIKYTSRISDLRAAGYVVTCARGEGGVNTYTIGRPEGFLF